MGFFESFKNIIENRFNISFPKLENVKFFSDNSLVKIGSVNIGVPPKKQDPDPKRLKLSKDGKTVDIDLLLLSEEERRLLLPMALEEQGHLLDTGARQDIDQLMKSKTNPETKDLLFLFKEILYPEDLMILKSAMFMKIHYDANKHSRALIIKKQISVRHGRRGRNITNLYCEGYFGSMLKPLYDNLSKKHPSDIQAKKKFYAIFDDIVNDLPHTTFVNSMQSREEVLAEVEKKINGVLEYGVNTFHIHGIGKDNINKIRWVLDQLEIIFEYDPEENRESNHISVTLTILKRKST